MSHTFQWGHNPHIQTNSTLPVQTHVFPGLSLHYKSYRLGGRVEFVLSCPTPCIFVTPLHQTGDSWIRGSLMDTVGGTGAHLTPEHWCLHHLITPKYGTL